MKDGRQKGRKVGREARRNDGEKKLKTRGDSGGKKRHQHVERRGYITGEGWRERVGG